MRLLYVLLYAASGVLALLLAGLAALWLARYRRRPKFRRGPLRPLESTVLAALLERSAPPVRERLAKQIALLRVHCRLHFEKLMTLSLYPEREDYPLLDAPDVCFPNRNEFPLATMSFVIRDAKFSAQFSAVNGRLFDVGIRPNPRHVLATSEINVTRFQQKTDPFVTAAIGTFDERLATIDAALPEDYVAWLRQTDGFEHGEWRVYPLAEVRSVPLGDHNYYCLADDGAIVLYVREGSRGGRLYTCAIADDDVMPTDASFRAIIEGSAP